MNIEDRLRDSFARHERLASVPADLMERVRICARRRRRWARVRMMAAAVIGVLALLLPIGWLTRPTAESDPGPAVDVSPAPLPSEQLSESVNLLLIGADQTVEDEAIRADVVMFVHVFADGTNLDVILIPQDILLPIPGHGDGLLSTTLALGGVELTERTVEEFAAVEIDHVARLEMPVLEPLTNAVGGVEMCVEPTADGEEVWKSSYPPYREFQAGCQELDGAAAVDYLRERHQFAEGEQSRLRHLKEYIVSFLTSVGQAGLLTDLGRIQRLYREIQHSLTLSTDFPLLALTSLLANLPADGLTIRILAATTQTSGDVRYQVPIDSEVDRLFTPYR